MSKDEKELSYDEYELPKNRKKRILSDLDELDLETDDSVFLVSSVIKNEPKSKKKKNEDEPTQEDIGGWLTTLSELSVSKIRGRTPRNFLSGKDKKKKKHKKGKNEPTDFAKEFEPEVALVDNLLIEQTRFVNSLQQKYDRMESTKSSARGTGKFTNDLVSNINQARQLASQLVDKKISVKKTIADLEMKERKEFSGGVNGDDMNNYAAEYLKTLMSQRSELVTGFGDTAIEDLDDEGVNNLFDSVVSDDRGDDVAAYLKYENRNVEIICIVNPDDFDDFTFIAETSDGEVLTDYPLPEESHIVLNRSTMIATDSYGRKYKAVFRE